MRLNAVVFPAPFGPIRPNMSPSPMLRSNSETAVRPPKRMVTLSSSSSAGISGSFHCHCLATEREEALRSRHHQTDDEQGVDDHSVIGEGAQKFGENCQDDGGENHAG